MADAEELRKRPPRAAAFRGRAAKRMGLDNGVVRIENVKDADGYIEAVFETMETERSVREVDQIRQARAVLARTLILNLDEIAKVTKPSARTCRNALLPPRANG